MGLSKTELERFNWPRKGAVRESHKLIWHSYPLDYGDMMLRSGDKRWTIIQGIQHFTLLDKGAAVFRCSSQDAAIEEAARRAGVNES